MDLRELVYGDEQVVSRIYFALRDPWWRTIPLRGAVRRWQARPDGFELDIDASSTWASHPLEVRLRYRAQGPVLECAFDAEASETFDYCRIGFCVLLPTSRYRGRSAISAFEGVTTDFVFPEQILTRDDASEAAARFHEPFDDLSTSLASGTRLDFAFSGDRFEFEDQRNWTDASYKAYSGGEWPRRAARGERFEQTIRLDVSPPLDPAPPLARDRIELGPPVGPLPSVGFFAARLSPASYRPAGGFQELNARRPHDEFGRSDSIELGVNGAVHADDDDSVMQTTTVHGEIVAQARAIAPGLPLRLAPVGFLDTAGDWRDDDGRYSPEPLLVQRDLRREGEFGATWVLASVAAAAPERPDELRYLGGGAPLSSPLGVVVERLAGLEGMQAREVTAPEPLRVLALETPEGTLLAVANTGPDAMRAQLPDGDELEVAGFGSAWVLLTSRPSAARHAGPTSSDTRSS